MKHFVKYTEKPLRSATLKPIRISCSQLLRCDENASNKDWRTFATAIVSDNSSPTDDVVHEKQLVLQLLIQHKKLDSTECLSLMHLFFNNRFMRRNDCIQTVLTIFENCEKLNILKSNELAGDVISWLYDYKQQTNIDVIRSIDLIDISLIAKLAGTVSINFLGVEPKILNSKNTCSDLTKCLALKFNSKFLCLERHAKDLEKLKNVEALLEDSAENCLIQLNYEKLMRTVNFETSLDLTIASILQDLKHLRIFIALFNQFVKFKIFNETNYSYCPLIKRISLFLNHIQSQLSQTQEAYTVDLLKLLSNVLEDLTINKILNIILKTQNLNGFVKFVKRTVEVCEKSTIDDDNDYGFEKTLCLKIYARVCVSEEQFKTALALIQKNKFNLDHDVVGIIDIIEVSSSLFKQESKFDLLSTIEKLYLSSVL